MLRKKSNSGESIINRRCGICKGKLGDHIRNGWPVTNPNTPICDECSATIVIPARLRIGMNEKTN